MSGCADRPWKVSWFVRRDYSTRGRNSFHELKLIVDVFSVFLSAWHNDRHLARLEYVV
jgi:hypothetical protein